LGVLGLQETCHAIDSFIDLSRLATDDLLLRDSICFWVAIDVVVFGGGRWGSGERWRRCGGV
jgi:hypothetical protein